MIWILLTLLGALFVLLLIAAALDGYRRKLERGYVKVGDLWEYAAPDTHPKRKTRGLYEVVRANVNTEAGSDSWVMRNCSTGMTLYMHHRQRTEPNSPWILCMRDGRPMRTERDVKRSLAVAGLIVAIVAVFPGCSMFESACTKALPVLTTAAVYLDDAGDKVSQAEALIVRLPDSPTREKGLQVIALLRTTLDAARAEVEAATTSCRALDIQTAFQAFIATWPKLAPFIGLLGGPDGGMQVATPLVISRAR